MIRHREVWRVSGSTVLCNSRAATTAEIQTALDEADSRIRRELPQLRFSALLLPVHLYITGCFPDQLRMTAVVVKSSDQVCIGDQDNVVIGGTWHALDPMSLGTARMVGALSAPYDLTAGRYLKLLGSTPEDEIIDETSHTEASTWSRTKKQLPRPPGLKAELFPYQVVGSTAMRVLAEYDIGSLLADKMGLGKTLQAITLLLDQRQKGPSLVVAPAALLPNWRRELSTFAPDLSTLLHKGPHRTGLVDGLCAADVLLTSYETVVRDRGIFEDVQWNAVVLDEAQLIRNPDVLRSKVVKSLKRRISVAVTGTPLENCLRDIWSVAEFVLPEALGDRANFEHTFTDDSQAARAVGSLIAPLTVRRSVEEVAADLPQKVEIVSEIEPDADDEVTSTRGARVEEMTHARMLCAHAEERGQFDPEWFKSKRKVQRTLDLVDEACANGDKVLVFSDYITTLDRLKVALQELNSVVYLDIVDGRLTPEERQAAIDDFSKSPGGGVLLLTPGAAGTGLNIDAANHVIHFNPQWNPAKTAQATARAYRRRQKKPVFVHHLFYGGTIEQSVVEKADFKQNLASSVDDGLLSK